MLLYAILRGTSFAKLPGMMPQMVFDEGGDEVVAMVVALLHPQMQWYASLAAGHAQQFRLDLTFEKLILTTLVNKNGAALPAATGDQFSGVIKTPASAVRPKIPFNAFSPQGQRIGDAMGAKAEIDLNRSGFFSPIVSAPWPPIECPAIPTRAGSTG